MSHEGGDDREVDAAIHQMGGETVAQRARGDACAKPGTGGSSADHRADVLGRDPPHLDRGTKQGATLATLEQVGQ